MPKVQFKDPMYRVDEADEKVRAMLYRSGDLSHKSTVRCYTRQGSAQVMMDYEERPNTDSSIITFLPGNLLPNCPSELLIACLKRSRGPL